MAQVQKAEVRERILAAGRDAFFEQGYDATTMSGIAKAAGVATANIYRYVPDKAALFEAVLPDDLIAEHDRLLDVRIDALVEPADDGDPADDLLRFWLAHRREVATLLDHEGTTSRSYYRTAFVGRLVGHVEATLPEPLDPAGRTLLEVVFDNTRRAIAAILRTTDDADEVRRLIQGFWSYQLPGLDGLLAWIGQPPSASTTG
ncbi:MAG TPA: helix-turn-helix domain-containing protein [Acidimicrobiales bacterium]|nr:helix-turn-helix domain-containing protein [Acidimicrobiales bacterium]